MVPDGPCNPGPEPRVWPLALALQVALLSGCSGSPLAERLSRSFPTASEPAAPAPTANNGQVQPPGALLSSGGTGSGASGVPPGAGPLNAGAMSGAGASAAGKTAADGRSPGGQPGDEPSAAVGSSRGKGAGATAPAPATGSPAAGSVAAGSGSLAAGSTAKPRDAAKPSVAVGQAAQAPGTGPAARAGIARARAAEPSNAAPYRVTLRLPRADPAAPAELVTRALRAAGVSFEVETIERMPAPAIAPPVASRKPAPALTTPAR
jgi:hypothetical protein